MDEPHEQRGSQSSKNRSEDVDPEVSSILIALLTLGVHPTDLVGCLSQAKGRVEASSTDCSCSVDHCKKSKGNRGTLKNSILAFLGLSVYLTKDAEAEEESAPELKKEHFAKAIIVNAAGGLIIGA